MNTNIFNIILVIFVLGFSITSCEKEESNWITTEFDYTMPTISDNGNFEISSRMYLSDINDYADIDLNIIGVESIDSWMRVEIDDDFGFSRGDIIKINKIKINNNWLDLDYYVKVGHDLQNSGSILFRNDSYYADFIHNAIRNITYNGYIDITIYGYSDMYTGNLYIVLANDLNLLLEGY